jgi:hypothetical protein
MRQMVCLAGLLLLTLDNAAGFSMAGVPRVVHAHKASVGRRGAPLRPRVCAMASSSTADDPTKRPITKLRLIQHKAEAFWFYRCRELDKSSHEIASLKIHDSMLILNISDT